MVTLDEVNLIHAPIQRCFDLARSVEVHLQGNIHFGEQALAMRSSTANLTSGLIGLDDTVTWQARHFFVRQRLTSQITAFHSPDYFQDTMLSGAFHSMQHDHFFRTLPSPRPASASDQRTEMRDIFRFAAPVPILGLVAEALVLRRYMRALLRERNRILQQIAECENWREYLPSMP